MSTGTKLPWQLIASVYMWVFLPSFLWFSCHVFQCFLSWSCVRHRQQELNVTDLNPLPSRCVCVYLGMAFEGCWVLKDKEFTLICTQWIYWFLSVCGCVSYMKVCMFLLDLSYKLFYDLAKENEIKRYGILCFKKRFCCLAACFMDKHDWPESVRHKYHFPFR